jgi:hypothetical protein
VLIYYVELGDNFCNICCSSDVFSLYFMWHMQLKNTVNLFIFYLVLSLIYFVFLFAVKHLCGNHSLDPLLCTSSAIVHHVCG